MFGLLLLVFGIKDYFTTRSFLNNSVTTTGTITSVSQETQNGTDPTTHTTTITTYYIPTISFNDSTGQSHSFTPSTRGSTPLQIGESITVRYSSTDPGTAQTDDFSSSWLGTILLLIIGAAFAGFGGLLLFVQKKGRQLLNPSDSNPGTNQEGLLSKILFLFIPDPRQRTNTINTAAMKVAGNAESITGYIFLIKLPVILLILGGLMSYLNMGWVIFFVLFALLVVQATLHIKAGRVIRAIPDDGTSSTFLRVFTTRQLYKIYQLVLNAPLGLVIAVVVLKLADIYSSQLPWLTSTIRILFIVGVAALPLLSAAAEYIRYHLYTRIPTEGKNTAQTNQAMLILDQQYSQINLIAALPFILAFLAYIGNFALTHQAAPGGTGSNSTLIVVLSFFVVGAIGIAVLGAVVVRRMKAINLDTPAIIQPQTTSKGDAVAIPDSTSAPLPALPANIQAGLFGIMNLNRHGFSILGGQGIMTNNENSLLVTNDSLNFIEVPATGENTLIGNVDYGAANFFWNRQELELNGRNLLVQQSLADILQSNPKNYSLSFENIQKFELFQDSKFFITVADGTQHKFLFLDPSYAEELKQILPRLLGEKFAVA